MPRQPSFICKNRHGTFYFRFIIPGHLRSRFSNKREIRKSLSTDSKRLAIKKARALRVQLDSYIEEISGMPEFTYLTMSFHENGKLKEIETDGTTEDNAAAKEMYDKYLENQPADTPEPVISPTIREVGEKYLAVWQEENPNGAPAAINYKKNAPKFFAFINDDLPVNDITRDHINKFYNDIMDLPARLHTTQKYDTVRYLEDIEAITTASEQKVGTSARTNYLKELRQILDFAMQEQYIRHNVARAFKPPRELSNTKDNQKREAFSNEDLKSIFDSEFFLNGWQGKTPKDQTLYWMFVLGLYTGARMGELLFLTRSAIIECPEHGTYINIENEIDDDGAAIRTVKNRNSIRQVPIHPTIIKLGFLDFLNQTDPSHQYIFPIIKKYSTTTRNTFSANSSKLLQEFGAHEKMKKVYHSFRHTLITHAVQNAGIKIEVVSTLTGHIEQSETLKLTSSVTYLKDYPVDVIKRHVVDKIQYGLEIEK